MLKKSILLSVIVLTAASCTKEGLDGNATLVVYLKHHEKVIENHVGYPDTVFVKFGAKELPGTNVSDFDTYFVGEEGEDHVHCESLSCGDYYIYGAGMDSTGPYRVVGGMAVTIAKKDKDSERDIDLFVKEL